MTGYSGVTAWILFQRQGPDILVGIDGVRSDEQLAALIMDHPVGMRSSHALRPDYFLQRRGDLVEFVIGTVWFVR